MTAIITSAPMSTNPPTIGRLRMPRLGIGKTFQIAISVLGGAYGSVYAPFTHDRSQPLAVAKEDLNARDPSW